jgi:PiT family inorganic phosphate transporter
LYLGGLRIVRTVGSGIFKLKPLDSFISQLSAAVVIFLSGQLGSPVSTSQIVSSSIMGVGAGEKFRSVKWDTVKKIFASWVTTIPAAALISYIVNSSIFVLIGK